MYGRCIAAGRPKQSKLGLVLIVDGAFPMGYGYCQSAGNGLDHDTVRERSRTGVSPLGFLTMAIGAVSTWMVSTPKFPTIAVLGATQTSVCFLAMVLFAWYVKRKAIVR